jgi:beta-lactamase regulating signal transducer with metallopeptidase domain
MRFLRHLGRLMKEFFGFAWHHKAWWIVPMIIILLLMTILIFCTQSLAPFIYTLY